MREFGRWTGWAVAGIAVVVMVVGLLPGDATPVDDAARTEVVAANLRCPFCSGESIAEAPAEVARDLRSFIAARVEEGWTDEQIYDYFAARYGERVRLAPPFGGWAAVLWLSPVVIAAVGVAAILSRRRSDRGGTVAEGHPPAPMLTEAERS